jgi:class 3 adenylate cyclase
MTIDPREPATVTGPPVDAVEHFPGSNPHPVIRLADDGRITYANPASARVLEALGGVVGEPLAEPWWTRIMDSAATRAPIELAVGAATFELLSVRLPTLGFTNVYGTDVTAARAVVKFPDQNPNPVFRLDWNGVLVYANPASESLIAGIGAVVGATLPAHVAELLLDTVTRGDRGTVEIVSNDRRYALLPVDVPEFGFINVYGTDITATRELEVLHRENERLLLNILPEPIAARLRAGEPMIADRFEDVSLLFADIVEFTRLSSGMSADRLVGVLNDVFTVFDRLVDQAGLEKVKTIGDAYMVVGGMPVTSDDHLERVANMALALDDEVARIGAARRLGVRFRVGIHAGPVVAGIIGTRKFIYDVWGDTVNVASRMESTGIPGRIQVTGAVEERLRGRFRFEPRGLVEIKGKGPMATWFLVAPGRRDRRDRSRPDRGPRAAPGPR